MLRNLRLRSSNVEYDTKFRFEVRVRGIGSRHEVRVGICDYAISFRNTSSRYVSTEMRSAIRIRGKKLGNRYAALFSDTRRRYKLVPDAMVWRHGPCGICYGLAKRGLRKTKCGTVLRNVSAESVWRIRTWKRIVECVSGESI